MIKAVVFDLDDTLFPEREFVYQGFDCVAKIIESEYKICQVKDKLIELFCADIKQVYNRLLNFYKLKYNTEFIDYLVNEYRRYVRTNLSAYSDVLSVLKKLKQNKFKIGLITDGRVDGQNNKIDALGIREYFDRIIITDELGIEFRKPHKYSFEFMANELSINLQEMMYVGDNRAKDFAVAKHLPITTVEIIRQDKLYNITEYLNGVEPTYKISTLDELFKLL